MSREAKAQLFFYASRGWYNHVISFSDEMLSRKGKDPILLFWKGFGIGICNGFNAARQHFEILK